MEEKNKIGTIVDGIAASEHIDSSGEILSIEGMDISSLGSADSILNFEHNSKDNPAQVCGKITFAKKIFKKSDCDNKRQEYFWDICKKPFVYVKGELFDHPSLDHDGARNVAALLRYDNRDKGKKARRLISFSIEGGKMEKKGMVVEKSIARDCALTIKHCNRMCIAEILDDIKDREQLYKNDTKSSTFRDLIIEDIRKNDTMHEDFQEQVDKFKDTKSFKQKQDKADQIDNMASKPKLKTPGYKPKRQFLPDKAPTKMKTGDRIVYPKTAKMKTGKDIYNDPDTWKSENNMRKAIVAGIMGGAPDSKTGMAALASEEIEPTLQKPFEIKKKTKKIKKSEIKQKQPHDIIEVHPKNFHKRVDRFREMNDMNRANVHPYSHEDYSQMRTFMTRDGKSGYAIKNGNELVSVHSSERGRGDHLVGHAVKMGAKKLDAYDIGGKLPKLYTKHGFQETGRYNFDPQYADPSNKLLHEHKPDFVEMSIPSIVKKSEKLEKMSQPMMSNPEVGSDVDSRMDVKRIDPSKSDLETKKIKNKYLQEEKRISGAKKLSDFDKKSQKQIKEYGSKFEGQIDPESQKGVNIQDPDYKINEAYSYKGSPRSTDHHESTHKFLSSVASKHSQDHLDSLVGHVIENFFDPKDMKSVSDFVESKYDKDYAHKEEEKITHILDLLQNKDKRKEFHEQFSHMNSGELHPSKAQKLDQERMGRLKTGWKNAVKFVNNLNSEELNKIHSKRKR